MQVDQVRSLYASMPGRLSRARRSFGRPLTLAEKILVSHCVDLDHQVWERGKAILRLSVDRVSMQDATRQMALLQFMQSARKRVAVPSTVRSDHLTRAHTGSAEDLARSLDEHREVYDFLRTPSRNFGIRFLRPASAIIHQL